MDEIIKLKKVNIVGTFFYHIFEDVFGNRIEEETNEEDYLQLRNEKPISPKKENCIWIGSYSDFKYDTPTGKITDGFYADNGNKFRVVVNNKEILNLDREQIVADEIIKADFDSIVADVSNITLIKNDGDSI